MAAAPWLPYGDGHGRGNGGWQVRGHNPKVHQREDGRWEIRCPDCARNAGTAGPVGIGLPVATKTVAMMLRDNHRGPVFRAG